MAESSTVDFNALPRAVRERLVACFDGEGRPAPLVSDVPSQAGGVVWFLLANLGGIVGLVAAAQELGNSLQPEPVLLVYVACIGCLVLSVLQVGRHGRLRRALPFKPGRYVLPMDLVDARTRTLRIVPMESLTDVRAGQSKDAQAGGGAVVLVLDGAEEALSVREKGLVDKAIRKIRESRAEVRRLAESNDVEALRALDPFAEIRSAVTGFPKGAPANAEGPAAASMPVLFRGPAIAALTVVLGIGLAFPIFSLRNAMSDDAMFERAVESASENGSTEDLQRYLGRGRRHVDEVRTSLLPRAALKSAKGSGTLTALRGFLLEYPDSCVDKEARDAVHGIYETALAGFRNKAATGDPRLLPFMTKLVGHLEAHKDGRVEVRFHSPSSKALAALDALLQSTAGAKLGGGRIVPVAPHFDDDHSRWRENRIVGNLKAGFSTVFMDELMELTLGDRISVDAPPPANEPGSRAAGDTAPSPSPKAASALGDIQVPTIEVQYRIEGGNLYKEEKGDRHFVGIVVHFDVTMRIPGEADVFDFALEVRPPSSFEVSYTAPWPQGKRPDLSHYGVLVEPRAEGPTEGPTEGQVYDEMAARAFAQLSLKLREVLFRPDGDAPGAPAVPDDAPKP